MLPCANILGCPRPAFSLRSLMFFLSIYVSSSSRPEIAFPRCLKSFVLNVCNSLGYPKLLRRSKLKFQSTLQKIPILPYSVLFCPMVLQYCIGVPLGPSLVLGYVSCRQQLPNPTEAPFFFVDRLVCACVCVFLNRSHCCAGVLVCCWPSRQDNKRSLLLAKLLLLRKD